MTDTQKTDILPKVQTVANMGTMALTGLSSSAIGDQVGDALAKILAWAIAVQCQCAPPADVLGAFHTICVVTVVGLAFIIHYLIVKKFNAT